MRDGGAVLEGSEVRVVYPLREAACLVGVSEEELLADAARGLLQLATRVPAGMRAYAVDVFSTATDNEDIHALKAIRRIPASERSVPVMKAEVDLVFLSIRDCLRIKQLWETKQSFFTFGASLRDWASVELCKPVGSNMKESPVRQWFFAFYPHPAPPFFDPQSFKQRRIFPSPEEISITKDSLFVTGFDLELYLSPGSGLKGGNDVRAQDEPSIQVFSYESMRLMRDDAVVALNQDVDAYEQCLHQGEEKETADLEANTLPELERYSDISLDILMAIESLGMDISKVKVRQIMPVLVGMAGKRGASILREDGDGVRYRAGEKEGLLTKDQLKSRLAYLRKKKKEQGSKRVRG